MFWDGKCFLGFRIVDSVIIPLKRLSCCVTSVTNGIMYFPEVTMLNNVQMCYDMLGKKAKLLNGRRHLRGVIVSVHKWKPL